MLICAGFVFVSLNAACFQTNREISQTAQTAPSVQPSPQISRTVKTDVAPTEKPSQTNGELTCLPNNLKTGDTLTLRMKTPHGGYLEIVAPDKKYIFLSEQDGDDLVKNAQAANANPFYAASEFSGLNEIKLDTQNASTVDYEKKAADGKYGLQKIFAAGGKYKILLSNDSFEIDDPLITGKCEVVFTK